MCKQSAPVDADDGIFTRGHNKYRRIQQVDISEVELRALYLIELPSGRESVLSGESTLGINTNGATITKVELVEGTPTYNPDYLKAAASSYIRKED